MMNQSEANSGFYDLSEALLHDALHGVVIPSSRPVLEAGLSLLKVQPLNVGLTCKQRIKGVPTCGFAPGFGCFALRDESLGGAKEYTVN